MISGMESNQSFGPRIPENENVRFMFDYDFDEWNEEFLDWIEQEAYRLEKEREQIINSRGETD